MINLANLTGLSYYEVNALVFCIVWPMLTIGLFLLLIIQKARLAKAKRESRHKSVFAGKNV